MLAVLVCHDGAEWLPSALAALRALRTRPRHVLAVDTGSTDRTPELLAEAAGGPDAVLHGVLTLDRDTGFGAAVRTAVDHAVDRWGDPGQWVWLLHDDCAPEPDCLAVLLSAADVAPSAGMLGPLALDWSDPRLVVEAGLSTDASGHRQTGVGPTELDWSRGSEANQTGEVLAVSSAGALVLRADWTALGGFDPALPLLRDDLDFGWRLNRLGRVVLFVPAARLRHARAMARGLREPHATSGSVRSVDRAHGLRTYLVNGSAPAFLLGLPRLVVLCVLRALGFTLLRRLSDARAELAAVDYLLGGRAGLRRARAARAGLGGNGSVAGLLTTRLTRLRNLVNRGLTNWVRRRVAADAALGTLPAEEARPARTTTARRPVGPDALPAGALGRPKRPRTAGLRRPAPAVAVPLVERPKPRPRPRPSPVPRGAPAPSEPELVLVEVARWRIIRQLLLAPPVLLLVFLVAVSLVLNGGRLSGHLAGGGLLPAQGLGATWSEYLATWHPVSGGTSAPAPAALAVLGVLGTVLYPVGGPAAAIALLLLGDAPLAGVLAYVATRRLPVRRWVRALLAAGYALLPPATAAVAQGRVDVVAAHILLPPVLVGIVAVLNPATRSGVTSWLSAAASSALGLAVIGAFAPLVHLLVLVFALVGFVAVPGAHGEGRRRVAALFAVVLLPLALLVPWPAEVLQHPAVLLSGVGNAAPADPVSVPELVLLDPGGPGALSWLGGLVLLAVIVAVVLRPGRAVLPGLGVAVLGAAAAGAVSAVPFTTSIGTGPQHFSAGAPLIVAGAGLFWAILAACRTDLGDRITAVPAVRLLAGLGVGAVLLLAAGDVLTGRSGPVRAGDGPALAAPLSAELTSSGRSVLILPAGDEPTRQAGGRMPAFGDDDLAPVQGVPERLASWAANLRSPDRNTVTATLADAATAGVLFVVLPDRATADRVLALAGDLVSRVPDTADGRPVLRLQPASGTATLISPELAKRAVTGGRPPTRLGQPGITPVAAAPPDVDVRVSEGAPGRLLVLAAEYDAGWQATIDGRTAPLTKAWGHLVSVVVPLNSSEIRITLPTGLRDSLLAVQAAALLFALVTAIPARPPLRNSGR